MATKWYSAHSVTPADAHSLQEIPNPGDYTDLGDGDYCLVELGDTIHIYQYSTSSSETETLDRVITPTGNSGNGRWILKRVLNSFKGGFDVAQGPPTDSTLSWNDGTRTLTITPTGASFDYYIDGVRYTQTGATSVVINDVEGEHWFYFDTDGVLKSADPGTITSDTLIMTKCLVANCYWDATNKEVLGVGEERHGSQMSPVTHAYLHDTFGARYESGLGLSNFDINGSGNDATAAQFDVADGTYHDEDIEIAITDNDPQSLTPGTIPTLYRLGAAAAWRKLTPTADFPVATGTVGTQLDYSDYNGGTWQLASVTSGKYVLTHYFAVNGILGSIVGFMGLSEYTTGPLAKAAAETEINSLVLAGLPGEEFIPIATVIWQTNTSYTNAVKARLISTDTGENYIDWRAAHLEGVGAIINDHESLSGLLGGGAGDHYHLTGVQATDLTDGGDTTLHDHDGISENTTHRSSDGTDHANVVLNDTHRASDGKNHSDVVLNNTHRASDGKNHSDVVLNNTHRGSDGSDHTFIDQSVISGASPVLKGTNFDAAEWDEQQNFDEAAITSSSNATAWNLNTAQSANHTLTENTTISAPTNMKAGSTYNLRVVQAAGVYTLAWNAAFEWGAAQAPAEPAASGDVVIFAFYTDGTTMYGAEFNRTEA